MGNSSSSQKPPTPSSGALSVMVCRSHSGLIPFDQEWKLCETEGHFYCLNCVQSGKASDSHVLSKGSFAHPWQRWNGNPKPCDICHHAWDPATHGGDQWAGFTCLKHNFDICQDCTLREMSTQGVFSSAIAHRKRFHNSRKPVAWVNFASTKEMTDARLEKGRVAAQRAAQTAGNSNSSPLNFRDRVYRDAQARKAGALDSLFAYDAQQQGYFG